MYFFRTGEYSFGEAVAYVPNIIVPAKLRIKHPYDPRGIEGDYWILGTDYDSFAVVFACFNFGQAMKWVILYTIMRKLLLRLYWCEISFLDFGTIKLSLLNYISNQVPTACHQNSYGKKLILHANSILFRNLITFYIH